MSLNAVKIRNASGEELYNLKEKNFEVFFGRDKKTCHVAFEPLNARVSRVHASLEWKEEGVIFTDKSKEGTTIEGVKVKQTSKQLDVGVHKIVIGGVLVTVEVEEDILDETVCESTLTEEEEEVPETPTEQDEPATVCDSIGNPLENLDEVGSLCSSAFEKERVNKKRRSDASLFEEAQPRVKKPAERSGKLDFYEEIENRGRKGPRARRPNERSIFDNETPAKKMKSEEDEIIVDQSLTEKHQKSPSLEPDEVDSIVKKVAALPSASSEKSKEEIAMDLEMEMQLDRGPAAPNETIKYVNLIFRPQNLESRNQMIDRNGPNFKKFRPKTFGDGRASVVSMYSTTSNVSNITTTLVDSRRYH